MSDLNVSLRLRLINMMAGGAREAINDLKGIENAAQSLNRSRPAIDGKIPAHVWVEQQRQIKLAAAEAEKFATQIGAVNLAIDGLSDAVGTFVAARTGLKMLRAEISAASVGANNAISMETAGYTPEDIARAQKRAAEISSQYKLFTRSQIEEQIAETTPALGNLDHSLEVQELLSKLRTIQEGQNPGGSSAHGLTLIVKALEEAGAANDLVKFKAYLEQMAKLTNTFKGTIKDEDWYGFFKRAGTLAAKSMSLDYVSGAGATFVNTVRGETAGVSQRQFYQAIVGSFMMPKSAAEFVELGLVPDKSKRILNSKGAVVGIKPGGIAGQELARTNPYKWVMEILEPAFEKLKLSENERDEKISALFLNPNSRNLVEFLRINVARIEKDRRLKDQAKGLDAADTWQEKSPTVAQKSSGQQIENTFRQGGEPFMPAYTKFFQTLGKAIDWWNTSVGDKHTWATPVASVAAFLAGGSLTSWLAKLALTRGAKFLGLLKDAPTVAPEVARAAPTAAEGAQAAGGASVFTRWLGQLAPALRASFFATLPMAISDAIDQHTINKPGFMEKIRADEAEEAKRKRENNPWNHVMQPDAANATQDFLTRIKGWVSGPSAAAGGEIGRVIGEAAKSGAANVDLAPVAQSMMAKYGGAIQGAEGPAVTAMESVVAKLKSMLNFDAQPSIRPRLLAPTGATPTGATPGGGSGGSTPKKQVRAGGNVYIQHASFHGVNDPKKLHDQVMARANRDAASANFASLHDVDVGGVG